jgi:hypothetical protein
MVRIDCFLNLPSQTSSLRIVLNIQIDLDKSCSERSPRQRNRLCFLGVEDLMTSTNLNFNSKTFRWPKILWSTIGQCIWNKTPLSNKTFVSICKMDSLFPLTVTPKNDIYSYSLVIWHLFVQGSRPILRRVRYLWNFHFPSFPSYSLQSINTIVCQRRTGEPIFVEVGASQ